MSAHQPLQGGESRWIATSGRKTRVTRSLDMAAHFDTLGWDVIEVVPAEGMVPRSVAEALAEALATVTERATYGYQDLKAGGVLLSTKSVASAALAEFRARYPREFADGATVEGAANPAQTPREETP